MPTAAKLVAAVLFAMTGFLAAETFKPQMPEGTAFGAFSLIVAGIGLICGWRVMGGLVGRGYLASAGFGLRTSVTIVFWALLGFSIHRMVSLSLSAMPYDGPMEAIVGIFEEMVEYGKLLLARDVIIALAVGGIFGGMAAEWASRRWR
jgi:hypothetical protein